MRIGTQQPCPNSIRYHNQSEACVGGASLEALCTRNEVYNPIHKY